MKKLYLLLVLSVALTASFYAQDTVEKDYYVQNVSSLELGNYKGVITVNTWNKPGAKVSVKIYCDDDDDSDNCAEKVSKTIIRFDSSTSSIKIETDYKKVKKSSSFLGINFNGDGNLPCVDYTITMPENAPLKIEDYKSAIKISGLHAPIKLETYKGVINVTDINNPVDFESYKGSAEFSYVSMTGNNSFDTYKGKITLIVPSDTKAALEKETSRKSDVVSEIELADDAPATISFDSYKGKLYIKKSR